MKTTITYELDDGDDVRPYADPLAGYAAVSEVTEYLRELDKYGIGADLPPETLIETIRVRVREICEDIPRDWKA